MKIHEYQAKNFFSKYKVPVPIGQICNTPKQALDIGATLGGYPVVVKAQIHAGGRGKGGGVKLAHSPKELETVASEIIGMNLVTHQTGPEGKQVNKVLVEQGLQIKSELYLSIIPDRSTAKVVIMASQQGGMDIEEVAEKTPEAIIKVYIDPLAGIQGHQLREIAYFLDLPKAAMKEGMGLLKNLYQLFVDYDCSLVEINPLIVTEDDRILALDAKMDFDDNALFRHEDVRLCRDETEEAPLEVEASEYHLNYISLDGNIGNIVNGAGLAMATMDIIKQAGAEPANFLDVGGGATSEMVENAFRIILKDEKVKGILINIFGGILRCDVFATGVVAAAEKTGLQLPVVVRMEGTNVEEGRRILKDSGLNFITAVDLKDAAGKVAGIVNQ